MCIVCYRFSFGTVCKQCKKRYVIPNNIINKFKKMHLETLEAIQKPSYLVSLCFPLDFDYWAYLDNLNDIRIVSNLTLYNKRYVRVQTYEPNQIDRRWLNNGEE